MDQRTPQKTPTTEAPRGDATRDGDPRACYVVLEDDLVKFRRIEYPVEETIKKIYEVPELDNFLGDRLRDGR